MDSLAPDGKEKKEKRKSEAVTFSLGSKKQPTEKDGIKVNVTR
jgi:hypothetical protein